MWATIYANQGRHENDGSFARERLFAMADSLHLDPARFAADFDSADADAVIATGASEARAAGVDSTPTLVIGGQVFIGAGYDEISAAIAALVP
jgi:protein-disulfide isomerase